MASDSLQLVCAHCLTTNRIPSSRLADRPKCGRCKQPIFTGKPISLSESSFSQHCSGNQLPLVIDFWAPWCGPCQMMAPAFSQLCAEMEPRLRFAKLNTEEHSQLSGQLGIRSIPTLILFQNGREIARHSGALSLASLREWILSRLPQEAT